MNYLSKKNQEKKGFTLLEILVTVALFTIISVFTASIVLSLSRGREIAKQKEDVQSELRNLLDTLGREMTWVVALETGCAGGCNASVKPMTFVTRVRPDTPEKEITYTFNAVQQTIYKREQKTFGRCASRPVPASCDEKILSDSIKVQSMQYYTVNNVDTVNQVTVTVALQGYIDLKGRRQSFSISSSFTPRFIQDQSALGASLPTPQWLWLAQACYWTASPDYNVTGGWLDDAKYSMHVERCFGVGCNSGFVPLEDYPGGEVDSSKFYTFSDLNHQSDAGKTYGYRLRLHNHSAVGVCTVGSPDITGVCGSYSPIMYVTLNKTPWTCPAPSGTRTTRPTSGGNGSGNTDPGLGGGKTGEQ